MKYLFVLTVLVIISCCACDGTDHLLEKEDGQLKRFAEISKMMHQQNRRMQGAYGNNQPLEHIIDTRGFGGYSGKPMKRRGFGGYSGNPKNGGYRN